MQTKKSPKVVVLSIYWITEIMDALPRKKNTYLKTKLLRAHPNSETSKEHHTYTTASFPGFFQALQYT